MLLQLRVRASGAVRSAQACVRVHKQGAGCYCCYIVLGEMLALSTTRKHLTLCLSVVRFYSTTTVRRDTWWKDKDDKDRREGGSRGYNRERDTRGYKGDGRGERRETEGWRGRGDRGDRREDRGDRRYERSDRREDRGDRREDRTDRREDRWDRKDDRWRGDRREERGEERRTDYRSYRREERDEDRDVENDRKEEHKSRKSDEDSKKDSRLPNFASQGKEKKSETRESEKASKEKTEEEVAENEEFHGHKKEKKSYTPYFTPPKDSSERRPLLLFKEKAQFSKHQWILPHQVVGQGFEYSPGELVDVYSVDEHLLGQAYVNPMSKIFGRFVSWAPDTVSQLNEEYFETKIAHAYARRIKTMANETGEFLYGRLVNSEGDFLPGVIIERYGTVFVVQTKTYAMDQKLDEIKGALTTLFKTTLIVERNDFASRGAEGLSQIRAMHVPEFEPEEQSTPESGNAEPVDAKSGNAETADAKSEVKKENAELEPDAAPKADPVVSFMETHPSGVSAKFKLDILRGQKTGYYFDQAFNRSLLSGIVRNKTVLDLYCYVGSWSIFAKKYGAKSCIGVDASRLAIQYAEQNAKLNELQGLDWKIGDVDDVLNSFIKEKKQFDVIVIDPPALVPKKSHFFQGFKKYLEIHHKAMSILPPGGIIYSCSCSYHMGVDQHLEFLQKAAEQMNKNITVLARGGLPADHPVDVFTPESDYLTCYVVQVW